MSEATDQGFCRLLSGAHAESLVASAASDTWVWLVLEYGGPWAAKAYDDAVLPASVRRSVDGWLANIPGARVQLIRRRSTPRDGEVHVYLAWTRPEHRVVRRVRLPSCEAIASLDIPGFVAAASRGEEPALGETPERPIVLVCTNGRRDRCCAKWGVPVYRALSRRDDLDVWQTTHLGGHRFAATLLTLPDGLCYGRVEPEEADALALSLHAGNIHRLDRFRGRTALPAGGQAAEHFFRTRTGQMRIDAVRGVELETIAEKTVARVRDDRGVEHPIAITRQTLPELVPPSCGKPPEPLHRWTELA